MVDQIASVIVGVYFAYSGFNILHNRTGMIEFARKSTLPSPRISVPLGGAVLLTAGLLQLTRIYFVYGSVLAIIFLVLANIFIHPIWKSEERASSATNFGLIGLLVKCSMRDLL